MVASHLLYEPYQDDQHKFLFIIKKFFQSFILDKQLSTYTFTED